MEESGYAGVALSAPCYAYELASAHVYMAGLARAGTRGNDDIAL
jgi:hypothetical protein